MTCQPCADFDRDATTHGVNPSCVECLLRDLARGPSFAHANRIKQRTAAYQSDLEAACPNDPEGGHVRAYKAAQRIRKAWAARG